MIRRTTDLSPAARAGFDAIIDVRSPSEFAEDHIPGAINLPVLDDAERAEIGTIYVQQSKFLARRHPHEQLVAGASSGLRPLGQPKSRGRRSRRRA